MNEFEQTLRQAIGMRLVVEFSYGGHHRVVEPHVLGVKNGHVDLVAYQVAGTSRSGGELPQWRRFRVSEMTRPRFTLLSFTPRQEAYGEHAPPFDVVWATVGVKDTVKMG